MRFEDLALHPLVLQAVRQQGYSEPTPIQAKAIPEVLSGRDVLGNAQTGTGKTAAFALPLVHRLLTRPAGGAREPRVLVLVPTRELAVQVSDSFATYGRGTGLRQAVVIGGVGQGQQVAALRAGVDVLVAAPGRLLDLMQQRLVSLRAVEVLVLDEADRMLDMGFINPIRKIVTALPSVRQNLLFSATMPAPIRALTAEILRNPVHVAVSPVASTVEQIEQQVYMIDQSSKIELLLRVLSEPEAERVIVFTRTKHGADRVARRLRVSGVPAEVIHGNRSQSQRQRALESLRDGRTRALVATDVAARGIDVDGVTHVINYDVPNDPESYVHRVGRTGRAGAAGLAISFCNSEERDYLRDIERVIKRQLRVAAHDIRPRPVEQPRSAGARSPNQGGGRRYSGHGAMLVKEAR